MMNHPFFPQNSDKPTWWTFGAPGVDDNPQILVANAFKARAALKDPQYILNVGDNFYWGGIEKTCGEPMNKTFGLNLGQFFFTRWDRMLEIFTSFQFEPTFRGI